MPAPETKPTVAALFAKSSPAVDCSRALVILEARYAEEASALLRDDPWVAAGILLPGEAIEWTIFLDSRRTCA